MGKSRNAWIQVPNFESFEIGEVKLSEIEKVWGSRWAQKCIRDVAEQVAVERFSPLPRKQSQTFCPPQLGFDNGEATLALSPWTDVKRAVLYGEPIQEFTTWTIYVNVKRGSRLFGLIPIDFSFEVVASTEDALEMIRIFFEHSPKEIPALARSWKERVNSHYQYRAIGAYFF